MVKNSSKLKAFEDDYIKGDKPNFWQNLKLVDQLYQEAKALSLFPPKDPLSGLETDLKLARVINSVPKTS